MRLMESQNHSTWFHYSSSRQQHTNNGTRYYSSSSNKSTEYKTNRVNNDYHSNNSMKKSTNYNSNNSVNYYEHQQQYDLQINSKNKKKKKYPVLFLQDAVDDNQSLNDDENQLLQWLENELEYRGIDPIVYGRYVLSLLQFNTEDVADSEVDSECDSITANTTKRNRVLSSNSGAQSQSTSSNSTNLGRYCEFHHKMFGGLHCKTALRSNDNTQKAPSTTKWMHRKYLQIPPNSKYGSSSDDGNEYRTIDDELFDRNCPDCVRNKSSVDQRKHAVLECLKTATDQKSGIELFVDQLCVKFDNVRQKQQQKELNNNSNYDVQSSIFSPKSSQYNSFKDQDSDSVRTGYYNKYSNNSFYRNNSNLEQTRKDSYSKNNSFNFETKSYSNYYKNKDPEKSFSESFETSSRRLGYNQFRSNNNFKQENDDDSTGNVSPSKANGFRDQALKYYAAFPALSNKKSSSTLSSTSSTLLSSPKSSKISQQSSFDDSVFMENNFSSTTTPNNSTKLTDDNEMSSLSGWNGQKIIKTIANNRKKASHLSNVNNESSTNSVEIKYIKPLSNSIGLVKSRPGPIVAPISNVDKSSNFTTLKKKTQSSSSAISSSTNENVIESNKRNVEWKNSKEPKTEASVSSASLSSSNTPVVSQVSQKELEKILNIMPSFLNPMKAVSNATTSSKATTSTEISETVKSVYSNDEDAMKKANNSNENILAKDMNSNIVNYMDSIEADLVSSDNIVQRAKSNRMHRSPTKSCAINQNKTTVDSSLLRKSNQPTFIDNCNVSKEVFVSSETSFTNSTSMTSSTATTTTASLYYNNRAAIVDLLPNFLKQKANLNNDDDNEVKCQTITTGATNDKKENFTHTEEDEDYVEDNCVTHSNTTTTTCVNNTHVMRTELIDANMCAEINQCTPPMSISKPMSSTSESYSDFNIGRKTFSEQLNDFDESYLNRTLNSIIDSNLISTSNNEAMSFKEQTHSNENNMHFLTNKNDYSYLFPNFNDDTNNISNKWETDRPTLDSKESLYQICNSIKDDFDETNDFILKSTDSFSLSNQPLNKEYNNKQSMSSLDFISYFWNKHSTVQYMDFLSNNKETNRIQGEANSEMKSYQQYLEEQMRLQKEISMMTAFHKLSSEDQSIPADNDKRASRVSLSNHESDYSAFQEVSSHSNWNIDDKVNKRLNDLNLNDQHSIDADQDEHYVKNFFQPILQSSSYDSNENLFSHSSDIEGKLATEREQQQCNKVNNVMTCSWNSIFNSNSLTSYQSSSCSSRDSLSGIPTVNYNENFTSLREMFEPKSTNCGCKLNCNGHLTQSSCCCIPEEYHCRVDQNYVANHNKSDKSTITENPLNVDNFKIDDLKLWTDLKISHSSDYSKLNINNSDEDDFNVNDLINDVLRLTGTDNYSNDDFKKSLKSADVCLSIEDKEPEVIDYDEIPMPYSKRNKLKNQIFGKMAPITNVHFEQRNSSKSSCLHQRDLFEVKQSEQHKESSSKMVDDDCDYSINRDLFVDNDNLAPENESFNDDYYYDYPVNGTQNQYYIDASDTEAHLQEYRNNLYNFNGCLINIPSENSDSLSIEKMIDLNFKSNSIENSLENKSTQKPCSFYMEGFCARGDCKFAHNLSSITCKYWEEGVCFKEEFCPFLHGYPQIDENKMIGNSKLDPNAKSFQFKIESDSDFPSLFGEKSDTVESSAEPQIFGKGSMQILRNQLFSSKNNRVNFEFRPTSHVDNLKQFSDDNFAQLIRKSKAEINCSEKTNGLIKIPSVNTKTEAEEEWPSLNNTNNSSSNSSLKNPIVSETTEKPVANIGSVNFNFREKLLKNRLKSQPSLSGRSNNSNLKFGTNPLKVNELS